MMCSPQEVHPEKWSEPLWVLFDNDKYSVVSGLCKGESRRRLFQRWNTMADRMTPEFGFPIDEWKRPQWLLVPEFLEIPLLHALIDELSANPGMQNCRVQLEQIFKELSRRRIDKDQRNAEMNQAMS